MPLARHPFGWRYFYLRLYAALFRSIATPMLWLLRKRIHQGVVCNDITVPSRDKGRSIKVHLYQPAGYDGTKPTPVLVNWHGLAKHRGLLYLILKLTYYYLYSLGFVVPSLGANREFCSLIAARTRCLVFDADYRKAPEHPFPAAIQDAEDITHYLAANPGQYDPSNIFLSGFSAGGNIALATASSLGPERIKGVIGMYPCVDLMKPPTAPEKRLLAGITISPFVRDIYVGSYIVPSQPPTDPLISPILAPTDSFPNHVYVVCGNADFLYNPAVKFVQRLKEAGYKDAAFVGFEYMGHGFDIGVKEGTEAEEKKDKAYAGAVDLIKRVIGASG